MKKLLAVLFLALTLTACSRPDAYYRSLERTYYMSCDSATLKATITEIEQGTVFTAICQKTK